MRRDGVAKKLVGNRATDLPHSCNMLPTGNAADEVEQRVSVCCISLGGNELHQTRRNDMSEWKMPLLG